MNNKALNELELEKDIQENFGVNADIQKAIVFKVPVGKMAEATLFLNGKKQLYLYINGQSKLVVSDIKSIVSKMGLVSDIYIPPKGRTNYFEDIGRVKFCDVFPGRTNISEDDLRYYKTLAPYIPALIIISEIKNGIVYQHDNDSNTGWRPSAKFNYRKIRTN